MLLDKTMQVWDVTTGNHMCSVYSVVLSPLDRKYITSGSSDKTSKLALGTPSIKNWQSVCL